MKTEAYRIFGQGRIAVNDGEIRRTSYSQTFEKKSDAVKHMKRLRRDAPNLSWTYEIQTVLRKGINYEGRNFN